MAESSTAITLQDLVDRAAISDVKSNYATGVDRRDWALYRSIFADTIDIDFVGWLKASISADEWVATVEGTVAGFDATQHTTTNHVITLNGNRAQLVCHMVARHFFEGACQLIGGFYTDRLERTADGWKIVACKLITTWTQGDMELFDRARQRGPRPRIGLDEAS